MAAFDAGGGGKVKQIANNLRELQYDVCVFVDSDAEDQFSAQDAADLAKNIISVVMWSGGVSIEERVIADLPWDGVMSSFHAARSIHEDDGKILNDIQSQYGDGFNRNHNEWVDELKLRTAIAEAAKKSDWFKSQSAALEWVTKIATFFDNSNIQSLDLVTKINALRAWIDRA